jgi:hypothetical protein
MIQDKKESKSQPIPSAPRWRTSLRLTFVYQGLDVELVSVQPVALIAVPSDTVTVREPRAGFWYTLFDNEGNPLYRRSAHIPFLPCGAILPEEEAAKRQSLWQEDVSGIRGRFTLIVPEIPQATAVILFSSPPEIEQRSQPAQPIGRFSLDYPKGGFQKSEQHQQ